MRKCHTTSALVCHTRPETKHYETRHLLGRGSGEVLMRAVATESEDEAASIERMLDDGAPPTAYPARRTRRSRWMPLTLVDEPSAEERAAQRRAERRVFRLYCFACGRSSDVLIAPARPGRCLHCGGTMQVELTAD
jgi:hypothetical protein